MPPLPADSIHARACKLKCEKILTRPTTILLFGKIILPKLTLVEAPLVPFLLTNKICEIMSEQTIWGHI